MAIYMLTNSDYDKSKQEHKWDNYSNYAAGDANYIIIVRAESEEEARQVEGSACWKDESTIVEEITEGPSEVIGVW